MMARALVLLFAAAAVAATQNEPVGERAGRPMQSEKGESSLEQINRVMEAFERSRTAVSKLEEKVATQQVLVTQITAENRHLRATLDELEVRVEYLEAINWKNVPRTCQDLRDMGIVKSGVYLIDPDGPRKGDAPVSAQCEMSGEAGITRINHSAAGLINVSSCPDPGCSIYGIVYEASKKQIDALIGLSQECQQTISYQCFAAPLNVEEVDVSWWIGSNNVKHFYWDGAHDPSVHVCACNATGSCVNERVYCNCDQSLAQWMADDGVLTDPAALPVRELRFGGLEFATQAARFELGPFSCSGRKEFNATESCKALYNAGHTASGYYFIDDPSNMNSFRMVKCNLDMEHTDPDFQEPTVVQLPSQ